VYAKILTSAIIPALNVCLICAFAVAVTVNGTAGGTRDNPIKINVKEDEGTIVLCYSFTFPSGVNLITGQCQTMDGTASESLCMHELNYT